MGRIIIKYKVGDEVNIIYRGRLYNAIINGIDTSLYRKGGEIRYILHIQNQGYSIIVKNEILCQK